MFNFLFLFSYCEFIIIFLYSLEYYSVDYEEVDSNISGGNFFIEGISNYKFYSYYECNNNVNYIEDEL